MVKWQCTTDLSGIDPLWSHSNIRRGSVCVLSSSFNGSKAAYRLQTLHFIRENNDLRAEYL